MGIEAAWVADGIAKNLDSRRESLGLLSNLRLPVEPTRAALGCIVGVGPEGGQIEALYFVLPACGGLEITVSGDLPMLRTVMTRAPIAKELIGKSLGDEVNVRRNREEPDSILLLI